MLSVGLIACAELIKAPSLNYLTLEHLGIGLADVKLVTSLAELNECVEALSKAQMVQ